MQILHVIKGMTKTAGTEVFVLGLAQQQIAAGHQVEVVCEEKIDHEIDGVKCRVLADIGEVGYLPDVVHIHAVWSTFCVKAMRWCVANRLPYIVSIHGCLMSRVFRKGWLKKTVFFHLFVKPLLQRARRIHCTGDGEVVAVKALGLKPKTFVAPLGCHLPEVEKVKVRGEGQQRTVLFLGRLGEEKGLDLLLDAWKQIKNEGWKLMIAGPSWLGYGEKLKNKVEVDGIRGVEFPGNADESMKDKLYREADLFVLSSPMENFSMVVLDALAYGVPVICTKGTPWRVIAEKNAGWWIEPNSAKSLQEALEKGMLLSDDERREMGLRGRCIAEGFSWPVIAKKFMEDCYVREGDET